MQTVFVRLNTVEIFNRKTGRTGRGINIEKRTGI